MASVTEITTLPVETRSTSEKSRDPEKDPEKVGTEISEKSSISAGEVQEDAGPNTTFPLANRLEMLTTSMNSSTIYRRAVQGAEAEGRPVSSSADVALLWHPADGQDVYRNASHLRPENGHRARRTAVLMAHDGFLPHVHVLRVPVQYHPSAVSYGPDAFVLHALLGYCGPMHRLCAQLHATRRSTCIAGDV